MRGELKCGVIDVGSRLADDLKEFGHEAEAVRDGFKENLDVDRPLNLTLS